jgi:plastocyanin
MVLPVPIAVRYRWLIRIGLAGYAATTITGWALDPVFYSTAYLAKGIEVALIVLLAIDFFRRDGNPIDVIPRKIIKLLSSTLIAGAIVVLAACSPNPAGQTVGSSIDPDAVRIAANDLAFSTNSLSAPADEPFQIAFDNQESAPHNVAIYRDSSAAEHVFGSEPFSGPAVVTYFVPALASGSYHFRCDVHPDMAGELTAG